MTKNYLRKFIKYVKKVYRIEEGLNALTDKRKNPSYTTGEVIVPVFLGFLLRIQSFNELIMDFELYKGSEDSLFNKLKTYGALEHCFVHPPNAIEAILYLMSTAFNLMQLFIFRRLSGSEIKRLTQKEIVRLLEKELYLLKYNRGYIFDMT